MPAIVVLRHCSLCKEEKPINEFPANKSEILGHGYQCKKCRLDSVKKSYWENAGTAREKARDRYAQNREVELARVKAYRKTARAKLLEKVRNRKSADKLRANRAVRTAVANGTLVRPSNCSRCGHNGRIEAHHYLGYSEDHWLSVIWLCKPCHRCLHRL